MKKFIEITRYAMNRPWFISMPKQKRRIHIQGALEFMYGA